MKAKMSPGKKKKPLMKKGIFVVVLRPDLIPHTHFKLGPSYFSLPSTRITGMYHHTQPKEDF